MTEPPDLSRGHQAEVRFREAVDHGLHVVKNDEDPTTITQEAADSLPNYLDVVTNEHLVGISSREDFIGEEHIIAFLDETSPALTRQAGRALCRAVFDPRLAIGSRVEHIEPEKLHLVLSPRADVGLRPRDESDVPSIRRDDRLRYYVAVQVGSLINFANKIDYKTAKQLAWFGEQGQILLNRLARFLEAKIAGAGEAGDTRTIEHLDTADVRTVVRGAISERYDRGRLALMLDVDTVADPVLREHFNTAMQVGTSRAEEAFTEYFTKLEEKATKLAGRAVFATAANNTEVIFNSSDSLDARDLLAYISALLGADLATTVEAYADLELDEDSLHPRQTRPSSIRRHINTRVGVKLRQTISIDDWNNRTMRITVVPADIEL